MVPIFDSDVAEERFSKGEWQHYELWEKLEVRLRRKNRMWIAATVLVFILLSSVPIIIEEGPYWKAIAGIRRLSQQISLLKREAGIERQPMRIRFSNDGSLSYIVERVDRCEEISGVPVRAGTLMSSANAADFRLLSQKEGEALSIPGLIDEFCYDPYLGSALFVRGEALRGFAIAPVKDLAEHRLDRMSVLLLSGPTAETIFE